MIGALTSLWAMAQGAAADAGAAAAGAVTEADRTDLEGGTYWMPPAATTNTDSVDWLFYAILALTFFCFIGITAAVVYFSWKYRHRPGHKAEPSRHHHDSLEITWTVIPSIIVVFIFIFGWEGFVDLFTPPKHAKEVQVIASKWQWSFRYYKEGFPIDTDVLHVPVDEPVRMVMRSQDVLHSFFVPAFRVKNDVIPNRYTKLWFEPTRPGVYRLTCAEYCGLQHSDMKTWVVVHEPGGFERWLDDKFAQIMKARAEDPVGYGKLIYDMKGCGNCHTTDGAPSTGPTFKGLWNKQEKLSDGSTLTVDENYIRQSILDPASQVVAGFTPQMPTFRGQLDDTEIDALIQFIKSLE